MPSRRRRRLGLSAAIAPIVLVVALVAGAVYVERRTDQVQRVEVAGGLLAPVVDGQAFNVLVVGVDEPGERTDTMVVVHVDRAAGHVILLPLPRDLVLGEATSGADRLNAAMARRGPDGLIAAIRDGLGIAVSHYVAVDFAGFRELVDAAGGISVRADRPLIDGPTGLELHAGCQHLDGEQTLALVRARHLEAATSDGIRSPMTGDDLTRIADQQLVMHLLFAQLLTMATDPAQMNTLLDVFAEHTTIDAGLDRSTIVDLAAWVHGLGAGAVTSATLPVLGSVLADGSMVWRVPLDVSPSDLFASTDPTAPGGTTPATPAIGRC